MNWIEVTDHYGKRHKLDSDSIRSVENHMIPAGDYFGPEVATFAVLHFHDGRGHMRVVENPDQMLNKMAPQEPTKGR